MVMMQCVWCETEVRADAVLCPECGLQNPAGTPRGGSTAVRRGRRVLLAVLAVPLMLSAAYAAHIGTLPLLPSDTSSAGLEKAAAIAAPTETDPVREAVWEDGQRAVRMALHQPGFTKFQSSFVYASAGSILTMCGQIPGTVGYASDTGEERFISVFGQAAGTVLEGTDSSFGVLWNSGLRPGRERGVTFIAR